MKVSFLPPEMDGLNPDQQKYLVCSNFSSELNKDLSLVRFQCRLETKAAGFAVSSRIISFFSIRLRRGQLLKVSIAKVILYFAVRMSLRLGFL